MNSCHLITGGAGFIGSCHVLRTRAAGTPVVTLDKLTYSGNLANLAPLAGDADHTFVQGDIGNSELVAHLLRTHRPAAVINFAAESHVDRSILDPEAFVRTNVLGTTALLRCVPSPSARPTRPTARTRPPRRPATTWCGPSMRLTACPCC